MRLSNRMIAIRATEMDYLYDEQSWLFVSVQCVNWFGKHDFMASGKSIWKWHVEMASGSGIRKWHLEVASGSSIWYFLQNLTDLYDYK